MLLNVITLGHSKTDNINQMVTINKSYLYRVHYWELFGTCYFWVSLITFTKCLHLPVITLSTIHCHCTTHLAACIPTNVCEDLLNGTTLSSVSLYFSVYSCLQFSFIFISPIRLSDHLYHSLPSISFSFSPFLHLSLLILF
jgi:hypothetical protein